MEIAHLGLLLSLAALALAAEPVAEAKKPEAGGPLAALPSAPGAHIEKLKALGDDSVARPGQAGRPTPSGHGPRPQPPAQPGLGIRHPTSARTARTAG